MNWDVFATVSAAIAALLSATVAFFATILPYIDKKAERAHAKTLKKMEIYERINAEALESFVRSANESIMSETMTEEFKKVNLTIHLHAPDMFWSHFSKVSNFIELGKYDSARDALSSVCLLMGAFDYFRASENIDSKLKKSKP